MDFLDAFCPEGRWRRASHIALAALSCASCGRSPEPAGDAGPIAAASAAPPLDTAAIERLGRTKPGEVVRVLRGPERQNGARAFALVARGAADDPSPRVEVLLVDLDGGAADRAELPTSGLWARGWPEEAPAEVTSVVAGDAIFVTLRYASEPACEGDAGARPAARARVEQAFVVAVDPVARIAAAAQTRYEPDDARLGRRRARATWDGTALVVEGEECPFPTTQPCVPLRETHRAIDATRPLGVAWSPALACP